jgi:hypothetical protein
MMLRYQPASHRAVRFETRSVLLRKSTEFGTGAIATEAK